MREVKALLVEPSDLTADGIHLKSDDRKLWTEDMIIVNSNPPRVLKNRFGFETVQAPPKSEKWWVRVLKFIAGSYASGD